MRLKIKFVKSSQLVKIMDKLIPGGQIPTQQGDATQQQQQAEKQEEIQRQQQDFKNQVLNQILDQQARARLSTLSLAKPEKAQAVESLLINMARMGRLGMGSKVNEAQLIDILEKVGGPQGSSNAGVGSGSSGVSFTRRRVDDDDDDEYSKIMEDL